MNAGVAAGDDGEADVAIAAVPHEVGAPGRVATHLQRAAHQARVVTVTMADGDLGGQLGDRLIQHGDVIGDRVRPGVARPQQHPERLAGGIGEAVDRMEPEPALVVRGRPVLVLRVHLMQRRVDVHHHRRRARRRRAAPPHRGAHLADRFPQPGQRRRVDVSERAIQRRVRRHRPEQIGLRTQMLDVGARLAAAGEHQHRLHQHLAPIVQRRPFAGDRDRRRQRITEPQTVGERPQDVQPDMGDDLVAATFHHHRDRAVTVHLASALQVSGSCVSTTSESLIWRALPRMGNPQLTKSRERSGLTERYWGRPCRRPASATMWGMRFHQSRLRMNIADETCSTLVGQLLAADGMTHRPGPVDIFRSVDPTRATSAQPQRVPLVLDHDENEVVGDVLYAEVSRDGSLWITASTAITELDHRTHLSGRFLGHTVGRPRHVFDWQLAASRSPIGRRPAGCGRCSSSPATTSTAAVVAGCRARPHRRRVG